MSPSPACGVKPPLSASTIVADATHMSHTLTIDGYMRTKQGIPTGEHLESHSFYVGGYSWRIRYYPNGQDEASTDYISLDLATTRNWVFSDGQIPVALNQKVDKPRLVEFCIQLADEAEAEPSPYPEYRMVKSFGSLERHGYPKFIKRSDLERSRYLRDDSIAVRCDMAVVNFRTDEVGCSTGCQVWGMVPPSNLHEHLGDLLSSEKGADVAFEVGDETLKAHRWLLAARSPVFSAELFGAMMESGSGAVVRVDDMEADVFKALLHFVYTDDLPAMKGEEEFVMSQHLLVAADRYDLERLKFICADNLCKHIEVGNVAAVLELADTHHCPRLKEACLDFLTAPKRLPAVLATDMFEHLLKKCPSIALDLIAKLGAGSRMHGGPSNDWAAAGSIMGGNEWGARWN
ncbi:hypothetical protein EJB05_22269, partial [Eragrostis curvula]